ncbi:Glycosyltransferase [Rhynchospora pubera]|uniref:Glycosyltransferase n=1 Tax=Rhynchospora pubera TaxID=906938 RepID=A0AAV8GTW1_9POAL|nr:Glycosyltransferase [Rhynchospora pubera]
MLFCSQAPAGIGHLIPMTELSRMLASPRLNFFVTIITKAPSVSSSEKDKQLFRSSLPSSVNIIFLPTTHPYDNSFTEVFLSAFPCDNSFTEVFLSALTSVPALRETIRPLKSSTRVVALITDFSSVDTIDVARELDVPFFVFGPFNLMVLSFLLHSPVIDRVIATEFWDMPVIKLPGWGTAIKGIDLGAAYQDRKGEPYN